MNMTNNMIVLKPFYASTCKRIHQIPKTFKELKEIILELFPELKEVKFRVQYKDSEGDVIDVNTDINLHEAYFHFKENEEEELKLEIKTSAQVLSKDSKSLFFEPQKQPSNEKLLLKYREEYDAFYKENETNLEQLIKELIRKELQNNNDKIHNIIIQQLSKTQFTRQNKKPAVHEGVMCDECKMFPIIGARYRCSQCTDYNICEICEYKEVHSHHQVIKYRKPLEHFNIELQSDAHMPTFSYTVYNSSPSFIDRIIEGASKLFGLDSPKSKEEQMAIAQCSKVQRIVGPLGNTATVELIFKNISKETWPSKCFLRKRVGDVQFYPLIIGAKLRPNETFSILVPISLPMKAGEYMLQLQLSSDRSYFGEPITIKITAQRSIIPNNTDTLICYQALNMEKNGIADFDLCLETLNRTKGNVEQAIKLLSDTCSN